MRRVLLWTLLTFAALVLFAVVAVELRVDDTELPAPDPRQPIDLPDGRVVSLGELLRRSLAPPAAPVEPLLPGEPDAAASADRAAAPAFDPLYPGMPWGPVFQLGEHHRQAGRPDQALALFQSIPEGDDDYPLARRRIALELLGRGDAQGAVPVVRQALAADPFSANAWQDTVRVYGCALGLPLD
ncbi:MAG TPA: tetratricopeptide repeat protein [Planctomycetota bacterium]|nr:tetratricopeptide repeat protein [Planctomycetota bacterium]